MKLKWLTSVVVGVASCALLLSALAQTVSVGAALNALQAGGTFTVNGIGDNTAKNDFVTLREELRLAKGSTDE